MTRTRVILRFLIYMSFVGYITGQCTYGKFGTNCNLKCRCRVDSECNQTTGRCSSTCRDGWMGPSCQYGNIAHKKIPSGTLSNSNYLVDGSQYSCSSKWNADSPYGSIDLSISFEVGRLLIYGGLDDYPLENFLVYVGSTEDYNFNKLCYNYTQSNAQKMVDVRCQAEISGQHVQVVFPGQRRNIYLCEIEIYGGQNIAYGKGTDQISTLGIAGSGLAVDGNPNTVFSGGSCTHTNQEKNAWWSVNLQGSYNISWIKIWNRDSNQWRLNGFQVSVTSSGQEKIVYTDTVAGDPPEEILVPVIPYIIGEKVTVLVPDRWTYLTLCEVEVYAECMNKTFGIGCLMQCNCENSEEICDRMDGSCAGGCKSGYSGDGCQTVCTKGTFGFGCQQSCPHCMDGNCEHTNGKCNTICDTGYEGFSCNQECAPGTYGQNCSHKCSDQCRKTLCHHKIGNCSLGCNAGYLGDKCETKCPNGRFGLQCNFNCSVFCSNASCDHIGGHCKKGCVAGYQGDTCSLKSPDDDGQTAIIGAVVGVVLAAAVIVTVIVLIICCRRRRKRSSKQNNRDMTMDMANVNTPKKGGEVKKVKNKQSKIPQNYATNSKFSDQTDEPCYEDMGFVEDKADKNDPVTDSQNYYNVGKVTKSPTEIKIQDLWSYVNARQSNEDIFEEEFQKLPNGMVKSFRAAKANMGKNRYRGIYAYDHSRVKLVPEDSTEGDYMNANYIDGYNRRQAYIASQGTTKENIDDFWRMLWQQKCTTVIMLTNVIEQGIQKCEVYWPKKGAVMTFGTITIALQKEEPFSDFIIRQLRASKGNDSRVIRQYHFTSWPDKDVPSYASSLVHFHRRVKPSMKKSPSPTVVHCSAGVGRTGTFIALDYLTDQGEKEGSVDIYRCVEQLREQRVNMIQTKNQYIFLHTSVVEALSCKSQEMSCNEFRKLYKQICDEQKKTGLSRTLEEELSKLEDVYACETATFKAGRDKENISKNRTQNILPADNERPLLSTPVEGCNPYINAVYLPGLRKKRQFIVTQTPLRNTTIDFWRMVFEQETETAVDFSSDPAKEQNKKWVKHAINVDIFYPSAGQMTIGPFTVTCTETEELNNCQTTVYTLTVSYTQIVTLKLYRPNFWTGEKNMPNLTIMLRFLDEAVQSCESDLNRPIVVICPNGASKCGLFCVTSVSLDRLKVDQEIATGQIIKKFRRTRPQIVQTMEELKFCYDLLFAYLEENETYSNFS